MKNEVFNTLEQLGIAWQNLVNGFIGATIWSIHKKAKFWAALRQIFIGGFVAAYTTPFLSKEFSVKETGFLSFVVGTIGMVVVDNIYIWASKKIRILFS